ADKELALGGAVSGKFSLRIPAGKFKSGIAWDAAGKLTSDRLSALGLNLTDVAAALRLKLGIVTLSALQARLEGAPLSADGQVLLVDTYPVALNVRLQGWDVAALQRLSPEFRPPVSLAGKFSTTADVSGTLSPLKLNATGAASASGL